MLNSILVQVLFLGHVSNCGSIECSSVANATLVSLTFQVAVRLLNLPI